MEVAKYIKEDHKEVWLRKIGDRVEIEVNFIDEDGMSGGGTTFGIPLKLLEELVNS